MDGSQLRRLKPELESFLDRYVGLFGRAENHEHARQLVQGLLDGSDRRNVENMAEAVKGGVVRTLQKFIAQASWQDRAVLGEFRRQVVETLGDEEAVVNVDETGFPKKGTKSVGVKRQYAGILGRVDNCQIGVFLNYASEAGHALLDRRLFLPQDWANDGQRRKEAGVPEGVIFRTKPELALEMVAEAVAAEVPFRWVGGDSLYGDSPTFVQGVRTLKKWYVLDVSSEARVWLSCPRRTRSGKAEQRPISVAEAARRLPADAWKRVTVADGSQGPRVYDYAEMIAWFSEEGLPTPTFERLLFRRSLGQEPEMKYQRSNAPMPIKLQRLAEVGGSRWTIEQDFQAAKGECGLDEYETRGWTGWHHHTALSMLALLFLVIQRKRLGEKRAPDERSRSACRAPAPARTAQVGRRGNPRMVRMASGAQSPSPVKSRTSPRRRTSAPATL
jgi:SRSO17 transposase